MDPEGFRSAIEALIAGALRRHVADRLLARPELVAVLGAEAIERIRQEVTKHLMHQETKGKTSLADLECRVVELFGQPGQMAWDLIMGKVPPVTKDENEGA